MLTSIHPFIHSSIHPFIHSSIHPFIHSYIHPCTHSFIHLSMHPASQLGSQSAATSSTLLSLYLLTFLPAYLRAITYMQCIHTSASLHAHHFWRTGWFVGSEADFCLWEIEVRNASSHISKRHACLQDLTPA